MAALKTTTTKVCLFCSGTSLTSMDHRVSSRNDPPQLTARCNRRCLPTYSMTAKCNRGCFVFVTVIRQDVNRRHHQFLLLRSELLSVLRTRSARLGSWLAAADCKMLLPQSSMATRAFLAGCSMLLSPLPRTSSSFWLHAARCGPPLVAMPLPP